jgi:serine/threonine-protein kinase RsbW
MLYNTGVKCVHPQRLAHESARNVESIMVTLQQETPRQSDVSRRKVQPRGQRESLASRAEIPCVVDRILAVMAGWQYSPQEIFRIRLALEEAIVNAIKHGHRDDPAKRVWVSFLVSAEMVLIEVQDEGPGFDVKKVPNPLAEENLEKSSGRGLLLMRSYMSWVRFNAAGNCVTMCRHRNAVDPW